MKKRKIFFVMGFVLLNLATMAQNLYDPRGFDMKSELFRNESNANELSVAKAPLNETPISDATIYLNALNLNQYNAFIGNVPNNAYLTMNLEDASFSKVGSYSTDPFPMAEEYAQGKVYRVLYDKKLMEVNVNDGSTELLGTITGAPGSITSLAYNWSNSTMYVLGYAGNQADFFIGTLDLETLEVTIVGDGATGIPIIAADFAADGYIYAPSITDTLYKIDPESGEISSVGSIGTNINFGQDVSYDYKTKKLYSITTSAFGTNRFGTYDMNTGKFSLIKYLGRQHAPTFTTVSNPADSLAPSEPTDFAITADENGQNIAQLSWTNPSVNAAGDPLNELSSVEVYSSSDNFNEPIYVLNNPVIGEPFSFNANVEAPGFYMFRVVAKNEYGIGFPVLDRSYIGKDKPSAPEEVVVSVDGMEAQLSWSVPTSGFNGGYLNTENLEYLIKRFPGNDTVAEGITDTTFNETIEEIGEYYYQVVAMNEIGVGGNQRSNYFVAGSYAVVEHFHAAEFPEGWTIKGKGDDNWRISYTDNAGGEAREICFISVPPSFDSASYLVSPVANTTDFEAIDLTFKSNIKDNGTNNDAYTLGVFTTSDGGENWDTVWYVNPTSNIGPKEYSLKITNDDVGSDSFQLAFGFIGLSDNINYWYIDDIEAFEGVIPNVDIEAISLAPTGMFKEGNDTTPSLIVKNNGVDDIDSCIVTMIIKEDEDTVHKETKTVYEKIISGDSLTIEMNNAWTVVEGEYEIIASVSLEGDLNGDNNQISGEIIAVPENGVITFASVWDDNDEVMINGKFHLGSNQFFPLGNSIKIRGGAWKDNEWYAISYAGEFGKINQNDGTFNSIGQTGCQGDVLTGLAYNPISGKFYTLILTDPYPNTTISLWEIDPETAEATKIGNSNHLGVAFAITFDDAGHLYVVEFKQNGNAKLHEMDENTAAMTEIGELGGKISSSFQCMSWDYKTGKCYFQATGGAGELNGTYEINVETGASTLVGEPFGETVSGLAIPHNYIPVEYEATFSVAGSDGGNAIEGASIIINNDTLTTDANGNATFELNNGDYDYTVTKDGYITKEGELVVYNGDVEENVALEIEEKYLLTFTVKENENNPIEGASIVINNETLTTDANGNATIELFNGNYSYTATKDGYVTKDGEIVINDGNVTENLELDLEIKKYLLTFTVKENANNGSSPIEGATIALNNETLTTDANGNASVELENGTYEYTVNKENYITFEGEIEINGMDIEKTVVLNPDGIIENETASIDVFPNPTNGVVKINVDGKYCITVINIAGEIILEKEIVNNDLLDLSSQAKGIYVIKFQNETSTAYYKLIIE